MKRLLRVLRVVAVAVVLFVAIGLAIGHFRFTARRDRVHAFTVAPLTIARDPQALERGRHLARTVGGCTDCHGDDLGGKPMAEDGAMRVVASNVTTGKGSAVVGYTDTDWVRAIVHGVDRQGHGLLVMPSKDFSSFSDDDVAALVAYMESVPPVDRVLARSEVKPFGTVVFGFSPPPIYDAEKIDHAARPAPAPSAGKTRAYGDYLLNVCRGCHGPTLAGGIPVRPGSPLSADISPSAMKSWTYPQLERALREGKHRDGTPIDDAMPWRATKELTDDELGAMWLGLRAE